MCQEFLFSFRTTTTGKVEKIMKNIETCIKNVSKLFEVQQTGRGFYIHLPTF